MKRLLLALGTAITLAIGGQQAEARSKAAQFVLDQHINEVCNDGGRFKASIDGNSLSEERDLTGDGRKDFIFDSRGIMCSDGMELAGCGPAACNVYFYVREGSLLRAAGDAFSVGFTVHPGNPPRIELRDRKFKVYFVRWNGSGFE